jgi:hypothetical protein
MDLEKYITPSLLALLPILYALGGTLKKSKLKDWLIPFVLGAAGIILACIWLMAEDFPSCASEVFKTLFAGISQGIICAAVTVYAHNLVKQYKKKDEESS